MRKGEREEGKERRRRGEREEGKKRWKGERKKGKVKTRRTIYAWASALSENRQDKQLTCRGISPTPS